MTVLAKIDTSSAEDVKPTSAVLIERARSMIPELRKRAREIENLGCIPDDIVEKLRDYGLLRAATPAFYGGYDNIDFDAVLEITMQLGRGCTATAWCYVLWLSHGTIAANRQIEAADAFFSTGPDTLSSTARNLVRLEIEPLDEGFMLEGHWRFSSGCDHSEWFILFGDNGMTFLVPRSQVDVIDDSWDPLGMRGTGSKDVKTKGKIFVPDAMVGGVMDIDFADPPGHLRLDRPSFKMAGPVFIYTILMPIIGAAQGCVDLYIERLRGTKPHVLSGTANAQNALTQHRLAEASAEVDLAYLVTMTDFRNLLKVSADGGMLKSMDRARIRRNQVMATQLCVQAANRLYAPVGGSAVRSEDQLQRCWRDVITGAHHAALPHDAVFEQYGRGALGLPFNSDTILREWYHPAMKDLAELREQVLFK